MIIEHADGRREVTAGFPTPSHYGLAQACELHPPRGRRGEALLVDPETHHHTGRYASPYVWFQFGKGPERVMDFLRGDR